MDLSCMVGTSRRLLHAAWSARRCRHYEAPNTVRKCWHRARPPGPRDDAGAARLGPERRAAQPATWIESPHRQRRHDAREVELPDQRQGPAGNRDEGDIAGDLLPELPFQFGLLLIRDPRTLQ